MSTFDEMREIVNEANRINHHKSFMYACGAAAKLAEECGYNEAQFLTLMSKSWEIMNSNSQSAKANDKNDNTPGRDSGERVGRI